MRESENSSTFIWWFCSYHLIFVGSKQMNMSTVKFKPGDYIFYKTKEGGMYPTIAERVGRRWIYCEVHDGRHAWVSQANCQLQEEWRKENNQ